MHAELRRNLKKKKKEKKAAAEKEEGAKKHSDAQVAPRREQLVFLLPSNDIE